ncbi:nitrite reductase small subunit NirD [Bordetella genomosp. 7]|uniref:Nitrite reductase (NAD(P)H) small subunit n=1 Tax=Bordetella genomosp. 7 TaxID=1416805 RepID=A0A261QZC0_9BORD|nr:nitrite reductase small subunit NirD [Bordetella genomosp. 7]OZI18114.1 nitrite reductase (NAD(P)H) small subunit [Bordetella genomosp. 7]
MQPAETCQWRSICHIEEIPVQGARVLRREGQDDIAVFRTSDNEVFAVIDRCPHKGGPLSAGLVHGRSVSCPLHGWVLDLATGSAQAPDEGCVQTVPIKVDGAAVYLEV